MKKLIIASTTLFLALFASQAFGQTVSDEISVSADIVSAVAINAEDDLTFGDVIAGNNGTIELDASGNLQASNAGDPQLGRFTLEGSDGEQYALAFTIPSELEDNGNSMPFTMSGTQFGFINDSNDQDGEFDPAEGVDIEFSTTDIEVLLGGQVEPSSDQEAGEYTGTITMEVSPTSF